tara:strand:- start:450 stop:623 length:174 start_codon:yes stop_codon:yes gene_type:complete
MSDSVLKIPNDTKECQTPERILDCLIVLDSLKGKSVQEIQDIFRTSIVIAKFNAKLL